MNPPEKIVNLYLRLNGFFTMPCFTTLSKKETRHTDIIALRPPSGIELLTNGNEEKKLSLDNDFFKLLNSNHKDIICLLCEIKGGETNNLLDNLEIKKNYVRNIFGDFNNNLQIILFTANIENNNDWPYLTKDILSCYKFIKTRFKEAQEITKSLKGLSKGGSWNWSEEFLSTLLYLNNLDNSN